MDSAPTKVASPRTRGQRFIRAVGYTGCYTAVLVVSIILIGHVVENWRGKAAWKKRKQELEAHGAILNWQKLIPPPVPDELNIFKAPRMAEWFIKPANPESATNHFAASLSLEALQQREPNLHFVTVAKVTVTQPASASAGTINQANADLILRYTVLGPAVFAQDYLITTNPADPNYTIPLIIFEDVPLYLGVTNLIKVAGLSNPPDSACFNFQTSVTNVSFRLENVTARQTLVALLNQNGLALVEDQAAHRFNIVRKTLGVSKTLVEPGVRTRLLQMLRQTSDASIVGSQGLLLTSKSPAGIHPAHLTFRTEKNLSVIDLTQICADLFPTEISAPASLRIEPTGTNSFNLQLGVATATDYLRWTDSSTADFDLIRSALKRPYARMDGDYSDPFHMPIPNFVSFRAVAQTLAQRAQCQLLAGSPEAALTELDLLNQIRRLTEAAPTGKPMTLVASMINAIVTGLMADVVADGLRLHAWHESQLAALQAQFQKIQLHTFLVEALREERVRSCFTLERLMGSDELNWHDFSPERFFALPRGWFYQSLVTMADLDQLVLDSVDLDHDRVFLSKLAEFNQQLELRCGRFHPYSFFASLFVLNYSRAVESTTRNQTKINQARVACALELYRLADGQYPETLAALEPQFIGKLPVDLVSGKSLLYQRTADGKFTLYSVGANEKDDGGSASLDWLWGAVNP